MINKIEFPIPVTKSFLPPIGEYTNEIERIWNSHWLTNNGELHNEFQMNLQQYLKVQNVSLMVNGHLALETALKSFKLEGEVITTPFTFASTAHAISNSGLKPVFCDINTDDFNINIESLESLITEKTSAILPVHVFGNPCDLNALELISKKYNLKLIYDSAHAFGVEVDGTGIGNFGDISMFSLHATKVFHSIEGGVLAYNNSDQMRFLELYKNFGISGPETVELIGTNAKLNEFQAAMGLVNLRYIDEEIQKRKVIANHYRRRLANVDGISFPSEKQGIKYNYAYFPVIINSEDFGVDRNVLHDRLKDYNIFTRKYFYPLCSDFDSYSDLPSDHLINAKSISQKVITLPIYSSLSIELVAYICNIILEISKTK